ncbi:hypothetical protein [Chengkuizengella axinellae]|uniref:Restriction endonuclease type IV Mrr domain-containing protein n=1 Tax=Chengkuizengella axinellae TaxID=3064388 RepID=A0ABT9IZM8_9BACL|nr:hypothetical protein [Chengkuizengella sp. 2205SS18-9]MDP5274760.1 hypothetical protein [Chengkuizengella sp. 2205SS18-9]
MDTELTVLFFTLIGIFIIYSFIKIMMIHPNEDQITINKSYTYKPFDIEAEYERVVKDQTPVTKNWDQVKPASSSRAPRHEWTRHEQITPEEEKEIATTSPNPHHNIQQMSPQELTGEQVLLEHLNALPNEVFQEVIMTVCERVLNMESSFKEYMSPIKTSFLFSGVMKIDGLLPLHMSYIGEVRKSVQPVPVEMKHINRILTKLNRGQIGVYITTSYFTERAQQQLSSSKSSIKLISGLDIVKCLKELHLVENNQIKASWLDEIYHKQQMSA